MHSAAAEVGQGVVGVILQVARTELGTDDVTLAPHTTGGGRLGRLGVRLAHDVDGGRRGARRVPRGARGARAARAAARSTSSASTAIRGRRRSIRRPARSPASVPMWRSRSSAMRVVVEVDVELGLTRVVWVGTAQDVGKAINPLAVEGQIEGGTAQGLGLALMEELVTRDGAILNASFTDYLLPTALDMPPVDIELVEVPEPDAPYGVKGVGEPPTVVSTAAILSAMRDGDRPPADARARAPGRHLPLSVGETMFPHEPPSSAQ